MNNDIPPDGWARHVLYAGIDGLGYWHFDCKGSSIFQHRAVRGGNDTLKQTRERQNLALEPTTLFTMTEVLFNKTILYFTP